MRPGTPCGLILILGGITRAMKRWALWAVLKNRERTVDVPSCDWNGIMLGLHDIFCSDLGRWSTPDGTWAVTGQEASRLATAIDGTGRYSCLGMCMVDVSYGNGVKGCQMTQASDGLSVEERTRRLVEFLREGDFTWKFDARESFPPMPLNTGCRTLSLRDRP